MPAKAEQQQNQSQRAGHAADQITDFILATLGTVFADHGHEGQGEGPFGKQSAQKIGDLEGDQEGIHVAAGAEHPRQNDVPHEAKNPRQQGHRTDHRGIPDQPFTHTQAPPTDVSYLKSGGFYLETPVQPSTGKITEQASLALTSGAKIRIVRLLSGPCIN